MNNKKGRTCNLSYERTIDAIKNQITNNYGFNLDSTNDHDLVQNYHKIIRNSDKCDNFTNKK